MSAQIKPAPSPQTDHIVETRGLEGRFPLPTHFLSR